MAEFLNNSLLIQPFLANSKCLKHALGHVFNHLYEFVELFGESDFMALQRTKTIESLLIRIVMGWTSMDVDAA